MTSKKLSQFPNLVQVGSPTSPGFAGMITAFAGSAIPNGWALCNGSTLDKTTYSQLFARIGATWDVGTNPLTGVAYSAPGGNLFRLPDLRGVFLRNVGDYAGADAYNTANDVALGAYKPDQFQGHYHDSGISIRALNNSAAGNYYLASQSSALDIGTVRPGQYDASANVTNGTPRTGYETAPKQVGVNYLIKLYDNLANADVYIPAASATETGLVSTAAQTIAGNKTLTGFTAFGSGNVTLKCKQFVGTTASTQGSDYVFAHNFGDSSKILSWQTTVTTASGLKFPDGYSGDSLYLFGTFLDATNLVIRNYTGSSTLVLSRPFSTLVWYTE